MKWPSWLLRVSESDQAYRLSRRVGIEVGWTFWQKTQFQSGEEELEAKPIYRTYALEPLLVAQDILYKKRLKPQIIGGKTEHYLGSLDTNDLFEIFDASHAAPRRSELFSGAEAAMLAQRKESLNYNKWIVTRELSVPPATQREIVDALELPEEERKQWTSDGIELISKTYHDNELDAGCQKLAKYLAQFRHVGNVQPAQSTPADSDGGEDDDPTTISQWLNATSGDVESGKAETWGAFDSTFAGTHVHIGLDWTISEGVDMNFLRHLSFLLISNERLISDLHAFKRHGKLTTFTPVSPVFTLASVR